MKQRVELIYDMDCPNVAEAREALLAAFAKAGVPASWSEWERSGPENPSYVRQYGSPTILVGGKDVAAAQPGEAADCCRVYFDERDGARRVPSVDRIAATLLRSPQGHPGRRSFVLALPGIGALFAPAGVCPACWPLYAGLLAAAGLGFLLDAAYLLPVTIALLVLALGPLAYRARSSRRYGPLVVGTAGAVLALVGKFAVPAAPWFYVGLALLIGASLWNGTRKIAVADSCAKCAPYVPEDLSMERAKKENSP